MKGSILILLAAVALSKGAHLSWSDCLNAETVNTLVQHENCRKYYQCDDGKLISRNCPADLVFNVEDQICDWPENVDCQNRYISDSDEDEPEPGTGGGHNDPSEAPAICAEEKSDGILIAHEYCNKYYICSNGQPVAMFCPRDLFFNADIDQCDWPENVDCDREVASQPQPDAEDGDDDNEDVVPEPEPQPEPLPDTDNENDDNDKPIGGGNNDPSQASEICAAEDSDGTLVAHEYCNKYYICHDGRPVAMRCYPGLFFNANTDQCDYPENVICDRGVAPQPEPQPEDSDEGEEGDDVSETQPESEQESDNEGGDDNAPIGGGNSDPSEAAEICAAEDSDGILVAHEYCNKYYICVHGEPVARPCSKGLYFNPNTDQCDYPDNVDCDRGVAPQPKPQPGSSNEDEESEDVSETQPESEQESDNDGGDDNAPIGGGNSDPSEAAEICAAEDSDGILVTHEYCNKYYICVHGQPVARPCSKGLYFNPNTDQCDYPDNVDCDRGVASLPKPQPGASDEDEESEDVSETQPESEQESDNESGDDNAPIGGGNSDPSEAAEICAAEDSDGILVAHEYCNKYYICVHGQPVARPCSKGLYFNPNTDQCDYPDNVDCDRGVAPLPKPQPGASDEDEESEDVSETQPESEQESDNESGDDNAPIGGGNSDPSEAAEICAAEDSDGILVAHEYCNKYYICVHGEPVARPCSKGLYFNPNTDQCDYPENVDCDRGVGPEPQPGDGGDDDSETVVPESEPQPENSSETDDENEDDSGPVGAGNNDPSVAPEICAAADSDGILIAHEFCNKFYKCSEGKPVAFRCYPGLYFNPKTDQCDWPENVDCDRGVAPQPEPLPETDNENEDNNGPVGAGNNDPSAAAEICAAADSDGILVAHEYCNKFYKCSEGKPVAFRCYPGLYFNPSTDQCDWPENVECDRGVAPQPELQPEASDEGGDDISETQPESEQESDSEGSDDNTPIGGGNSDPSEAAAICAAEDSDGILIAHEYCNKYYICVYGQPVARPCSKGLYFNPNTDQCDYPDNVNCDRDVAPQPEPQPDEDGESDNEDVVPEPEPQPEPLPDTDNDNNDENGPVGAGNNDPSAAKEICAAEESDGVLVAHEYCNQFYVCSNGEPVVLTCPSDLYFNAYRDRCEWSDKVDCDRGVAPETH